jgi:hypothetical protein
MSVGYAYDGKVIQVALTRNYSDNDFRNVIYKALSDPAFESGMSLLVDMRESSETRTPDELRWKVIFLKTLRSRLSPFCAVVVSSPSHYGMAEVFSTFAESEGIEVLVTYDIEQAKHWLRSS